MKRLGINIASSQFQNREFQKLGFCRKEMKRVRGEGLSFLEKVGAKEERTLEGEER